MLKQVIAVRQQNSADPRLTDRKGFKRRFGAILERLNGGFISRRQAARELEIGYATLKRLLDSGYMAGGLE